MSRKALVSAVAGFLSTLAFSASAAASVSALAVGGGVRPPAAARGPEILLPPAAAGTLHIGEVIELRWRGVPRDAEEMELLLSLDGGRTFAVRVTPDLDVDRGAFSWRVPPLPACHARLAMRINLAGREVFAGLSAPFRIAATGGKTLPWTVRSRGGDLWLGGPDGDATGEVNRDLAAGAPRPRLSPLWPGLAPAAPESPRPARSRAVAASARRPSFRGLAARSRALPAPPRLPLELPLRI